MRVWGSREWSAEPAGARFSTLPAPATPCSACSHSRLRRVPHCRMPPCSQTRPQVWWLENLAQPAPPRRNLRLPWTICGADSALHDSFQNDGGKMKDFLLEFTHTFNLLVRRLFSTSFLSGNGENGLTSIVKITPFAPFRDSAFTIE